MSIDEEKKALRRAVRGRLALLDPEELIQSDSALFDTFLSLPQVAAADTIFAFWGIPGREPDTSRLIGALLRRGKKVGLPRMLPGYQMEVRRFEGDRPLCQAAHGILEPARDCPLLLPGEIDLALVPALCYDRRGYRLGFGGGYYDRWLKGFSGMRVGLCRRVVLQDQVPAGAHDARVDILAVEGESLSF